MGKKAGEDDGEKRQLTKSWKMMEEKSWGLGGRPRGTVSTCWTHDRCPWPFAEWLPCWQELTSVFKQDKTNGTSTSPPAH